jgi:hypothetical protein
VKAAALAVRFALELCALAALAYGGWRLGGPAWLRLLLAIALPVIAAAIWGRWVAPRAKHLLADPVRLVPEWIVVGGAALALVANGHPVLAAAFVLLAAVDRLVLWRLDTGTGGQPLRP